VGRRGSEGAVPTPRLPRDSESGWPGHLQTLFSNLKETLTLTEIHTTLTGKKPGRRRDVDILNRTAIVLAVARWESFVEDLARAAFNHLLLKALTPDLFPTKVLALAGAELRSASDVRRIWELAAEGWRQVLIGHRDRVLAAFLDSFHTPRPEKVDHLLEQLIGLKDLSHQWNWRNSRAAHVSKRLNDLVSLRGSIAHRVSAGRYVYKREVKDAVNLVQCLAAVSSNRVRTFLVTRSPEEPWIAVTYGSVE